MEKLSVFNYKGYKEFFLEYVDRLPGTGRGFFTKAAKAMRVHPTQLTHVFKGDKDLTVEQGQLLGIFLELNELELNYFVYLIMYARAGTQELKSLFKEKLQDFLRKQQSSGTGIVNNDFLTEEDKFEFYSNWYYPVVYHLCEVFQEKNLKLMAKLTMLSESDIENAFSFLEKKKMISVKKDGVIQVHLLDFYLNKDSKLIWNYHRTWRLKAFESHENKRESELFFTYSFAISEESIASIQRKIKDFIQEICSDVENKKEAEAVMCLGLDWFNPCKRVGNES